MSMRGLLYFSGAVLVVAMVALVHVGSRVCCLSHTSCSHPPDPSAQLLSLPLYRLAANPRCLRNGSDFQSEARERQSFLSCLSAAGCPRRVNQRARILIKVW